MGLPLKIASKSLDGISFMCVKRCMKLIFMYPNIRKEFLFLEFTFPVKNKPLVSVITGTYNSINYLDNLIFSMKNQSFQDFEVIFIDDGSKDGTRDYLKEFCEKNEQFKLILKQPEVVLQK